MAVTSVKEIADRFLDEIRSRVTEIGGRPKLVGFLANEQEASWSYSEHTRNCCERVGIEYQLVRTARLELEDKVAAANADSSIHGIMIYYPIFGGERDSYLRALVEPSKDVEGLNPYWLTMLYANKRLVEGPHGQFKAILPCTSLAVLKILDVLGVMASDKLPFAGKTVTIFNRSEVVGRPLAFMISNDGASVFSFDINDVLEFAPGAKVTESKISRREALAQSDIVITGVPSRDFEPIGGGEIKPGAVCVNFSMIRNFADDIEETCGLYVPKTGAVTTAMCLRNTLRLYENYSGFPAGAVPS